MGLFEKRRARKFFIFVQDFDENNPKTHHGMDLTTTTARQLISLVFHSYALYCMCLVRGLESRFLNGVWWESSGKEIQGTQIIPMEITTLILEMLVILKVEHELIIFEFWLVGLICRKYELEDDTIDFIGHALALHFSDDYLDKPAMSFVKRMKVEIQ